MPQNFFFFQLQSPDGVHLPYPWSAELGSCSRTNSSRTNIDLCNCRSCSHDAALSFTIASFSMSMSDSYSSFSSASTLPTTASSSCNSRKNDQGGAANWSCDKASSPAKAKFSVHAALLMRSAFLSATALLDKDLIPERTIQNRVQLLLQHGMWLED